MMNVNKFWKNEITKYLLVIKFLFSLLFPIMVVIYHQESINRFYVAFTESIAITIISIFIYEKSHLGGYLVNSFLFFLMNFQYILLYWANSFLDETMLANITQINALSDSYGRYSISVLSLVIFSFLPFRYSKHKNTFILIPVVIIIYGSFLILKIQKYSHSYSFIYLIKNIQKFNSTSIHFQENEFHHSDIKQFIKRPSLLSEKPNIILIFTEGLSQHIIEDKRNIMPNVRKLQDKSITFKNYYNHTFATFKGLQGQLYSGYQRSNLDKSNLISLQKILERNGYITYYIITEPNAKYMVDYIKDMKFMQIINNNNKSDHGTVISDKLAYEILDQTALNAYKEGHPFFIAMYTNGTHVYVDSPHKKYGDGKNILLNRFYNADFQLGVFFEKFLKSTYSDNTIFIYTADHATYKDNDFIYTFPKYDRNYSSIDRIPLSIYYKNVVHRNIDVNGRNSLCLAPTILDLLDISDENYFLGSSLWGKGDNDFEYIYFEFESLSNCVKTKNAKITGLSQAEDSLFKSLLFSYFALKKKDSI